MTRLTEQLEIPTHARTILRAHFEDLSPEEENQELTSMSQASLMKINGIGRTLAREIWEAIREVKIEARRASLEGQLIAKIREANEIANALDPRGVRLMITTEGGRVRLWKRA